MHRCFWVDLKDEEYIHYHDHEWGVPVHDDQKLFEMLILESFQAGLSWQCVLHKRNAFRKAFDNFDVRKVSAFSPEKIGKLAQNPDLIRHRKKIESAVQNAHVFLTIQKEFGSFSIYLWRWTNGKVLRIDAIATQSPLAEQISKDLKKRGMTFVGPTTIHAYLCAIGVFNAHSEKCDFKRK